MYGWAAEELRGGGNVQEIPKAQEQQQDKGKQPRAVPREAQAGYWENSFMERVVQPRAVLEPHPWVGLKCGGGTWGSGNGWTQGELFYPKQFYNSVFSSQGRGAASQKKKKATSKWEFSLCDVERFVGRGVTRVSVEKKYNLRDLPT